MNLLLLQGIWSLVREQNCNISTKGSKLPLLSFASPSVLTTPGGKVSSGSCGSPFKTLGCYRNKASLAEVMLVQIYPCGTLWYQASNKVPQKTEQISFSLPLLLFVLSSFPCSPLIQASSSHGRTPTWRSTSQRTVMPTLLLTTTRELFSPPWTVKVKHMFWPLTFHYGDGCVYV